MESLNNPIEKLNVLERKLSNLIELVENFKEENIKLKAERDELISDMEQLKNTMLKGNQDLEDINQERELTRVVVDDLIKSIDTFVDKKEEVKADGKDKDSETGDSSVIHLKQEQQEQSAY